MSDLPDELLQQLIDLIDRLREETAGWFDEPGDQQLWYNRGYANGMVLALTELMPLAALDGRVPDSADDLQPLVSMPWGKAYIHGQDTGHRETYEITGIKAP